MYYPAKFSKEVDGYTVTFRDIPEAVTCGDTYEDAMAMAEDVLMSSVDVYLESGRLFPIPTDQIQNDETRVFLPDQTYEKVLRHNSALAGKNQLE